MAINITMPALSPTMEEGNLAKWLVKEGDTVSAGDVIAEIETDKATMEVEAVDEGIVAKLVVDAGSEGVKVNAVIAVLAEEGEDIAKVGADPVSVNGVQSDSESKKPESVTSTVSTPPVSAQIQESPSAVSGTSKDRVFASPLARRIARDSGIDLAVIKGSGPGGRVVKRDVENYSGATASAVVSRDTGVSGAQVAGGKVAAISSDQTLKMFEEGSFELIPHDNMRKIIAKRLVQSKQTVPHFYLSVDCEIDSLLKIRSEINSAAPVVDGNPIYKISVNDIIIKALALGLRDIPEANVSWSEDNMIRHKHCDVGVAVSIPGGLITPIIRNAEEKSLSVIANEMKDLAARARNRKLLPQEYQGGSTAVSNLGMFGIKDFSAVINPPHATILAVGGGEKRANVKDGEIKVATMMSVTLSTDHRAVDGVLGAQLLGSFKQYVENPISMLV
ncbi:MAG: pyruvate dehydrogenase complex dihydrolipoamide acetyltransferase [Hyphomicrobiales bacterium]|nr:pyruvate dehydrogenase complex dihydrolipoamide acetyltransferase [Hyphomicrobiales bacterium]